MPLWMRVDLCIMPMKGYFQLPKAPGQEPHCWMQFSFICRTLVGWALSMKGYSTFPKAPGLEPHNQMQFCVMYKTLVWRVSGNEGVFYTPKSTRTQTSSSNVVWYYTQYTSSGEGHLTALPRVQSAYSKPHQNSCQVFRYKNGCEFESHWVLIFFFFITDKNCLLLL